jgi:hypothetical protein
LLKKVTPQEDNGEVWVGEAVGFNITTLAYKILARPVLVLAVKLGPSENETNGALHNPK